MSVIIGLFTAFITAIVLDRSYPQEHRINLYSSASFRLNNAAKHVAGYFSSVNSLPRRFFYSFLYYSLLLIVLMFFYMFFFRETYDFIIWQFLTNTAVFLFFSFCFYLTSIISFFQTSIFLNLLQVSENYLSSFYILLSDILLSVVLFIFFSSVIFTLALELLPRGKPSTYSAEAIEICFLENPCLTKIVLGDQTPTIYAKSDELYNFAHTASELEGKFANLDHLPSLQFSKANSSYEDWKSFFTDKFKFLKNAEIKFYNVTIGISGYLPVSTFEKVSIFFNRNINGITELIRSGFTYLPSQSPLLEKFDYPTTYFLSEWENSEDYITETEYITDRQRIIAYEGNWWIAASQEMQNLDSSLEGFYVKSMKEDVSFASARELVKALIHEDNKRKYYDFAQSTSLWSAIFPNDKNKVSSEHLKIPVLIFFVTAISLSTFTLIVFIFLTLAKLMLRATSYVIPEKIYMNNTSFIYRTISTYPITFVLTALFVLETLLFLLIDT